ncbi:MAG: hypothetical protein J5858_00490 [Lentisphaeria bacterium]|nr:hypothetical protein [Lentisphaeria bacterium]
MLLTTVFLAVFLAADLDFAAVVSATAFLMGTEDFFPTALFAVFTAAVLFFETAVEVFATFLGLVVFAFIAILAPSIGLLIV